MTGLDRDSKNITTAEIRDNNGDLLVPERELDYDILVMALGSTSNDFGTRDQRKLHLPRQPVTGKPLP